MTGLLVTDVGWAATVLGRVGCGQTKAYAFDSQSSGQLLLTLFWKTKGTDLVLQVVCDNEVVGAATGRADRFQRIEVGLPAGRVCEVGVSAVKGSTPFWLNLQYTGNSSMSQAGHLRVVNTSSGRLSRLRELTTVEALDQFRLKRR